MGANLLTVDLSQYVNRHSRGSRFCRLLWECVWLVLFRLTPRWCLNGWRCLLLRLFGAQIGKAVRISGSAKVWQPWKLSVGDNSWIDGHVSLYSVDEIRIGRNVVVSEGAFLCTASHDIRSEAFELVTKSITIQDAAWICARAIILPGVVVREGGVVGAGAVAVSDVEQWSVVGGNPARLIAERHPL